mmetsp:Transcript_58421/g.169451  ORF Transcript_58421/g.169451 Transcript_58421/m.169451 type:complete len:242 (-) Transcript_58421:1767-2492(-)
MQRRREDHHIPRQPDDAGAAGDLDHVRPRCREPGADDGLAGELLALHALRAAEGRAARPWLPLEGERARSHPPDLQLESVPFVGHHPSVGKCPGGPRRRVDVRRFHLWCHSLIHCRDGRRGRRYNVFFAGAVRLQRRRARPRRPRAVLDVGHRWASGPRADAGSRGTNDIDYLAQCEVGHGGRPDFGAIDDVDGRLVDWRLLGTWHQDGRAIGLCGAMQFLLARSCGHQLRAARKPVPPEF